MRLLAADAARHAQRVELVERMLALHRQAAFMPNAATDAQLDRRSDRLVYALYDLTDEEIRIVEEATA